MPDPALAVADHHDRGEAEPPSALDHLGDAIDVDQAIDQLAVLALVAARGMSLLASHQRAIQILCISEDQAAGARRIGQRLDPAMVAVRAAVEHHRLDAGAFRPLGNQLADLLRRRWSAPVPSCARSPHPGSSGGERASAWSSIT